VISEPGPPSSEPPPAASNQPGLGDLFFSFLGVGLSGFGGVLPWARRMMVEQKQWMSAEEFAEILSLCQFVPGPNIVSMSVLVGRRYQGLVGAIVACVGLCGAPLVLAVILGALYARYGELPAVNGLISGLAAAGSGLIAATALKMLEPLFRPHARWGLVLVLPVFGAIGVLRLPLLGVIAVMAPIGIGLAWWKTR
jgi:chromate transporter